MDKQADRQTDRQTDRRTNRQTDNIQTGKRAGRQIDRKTVNQLVRCFGESVTQPAECILLFKLLKFETPSWVSSFLLVLELLQTC